MDKILRDRDNQNDDSERPQADRGGSAQADNTDDMKEVMTSAIENLIDETRLKYRYFKNIHVLQANDSRVLAKYKSTQFDGFEARPSDDPVELLHAFMRRATSCSKQQAESDNMLIDEELPRDSSGNVTPFESKFLESDRSVIQEASED